MKKARSQTTQENSSENRKKEKFPFLPSSSSNDIHFLSGFKGLYEKGIWLQNVIRV